MAHFLVDQYNHIERREQSSIVVKNDNDPNGYSVVTFCVAPHPAFNKILVSGDLVDVILPARNRSHFAQALDYASRATPPPEYTVTSKRAILEGLKDEILQADNDDLLEWLGKHGYGAEDVTTLKTIWADALTEALPEVVGWPSDWDDDDDLPIERGVEVLEAIQQEGQNSAGWCSSMGIMFEWLEDTVIDSDYIREAMPTHPTKDYKTAQEIAAKAWALLVDTSPKE